MDISHRKVTKKIRFTDSQGNPLARKEIGVRQVRHSFLFGSGAFFFLPFTLEPEKYGRMAESWLDIFNYGTLPFYWGTYEQEEGHTRKDLVMNAALYLKDKGVKIKGHPLCWHTVCADWLLKYDNDTIMRKQLERIDREVTDFKGVIDMWDVINEVVIMPVFDKYDNAVTRICNAKGQVGLVKAVFDRTRENNPGAVLLLNDFNTSSAYEDLIDRCLDAGVKIDVIGIQSHQHQGYWGAEKINDVLERFSRFGLPLHFTENTIISGDLMPEHIDDLNDWQVEDWPSTPEGEERQAREMEEMYRILFGHPLVQAITVWDYKDGAWLGAPAGIIRKDDSPKPAYEMLRGLIRKEWWTDLKVVTDEQGYATVDAFKGTYSISEGGKSVEIELADDTGTTIAI